MRKTYKKPNYLGCFLLIKIVDVDIVFLQGDDVKVFVMFCFGVLFSQETSLRKLRHLPSPLWDGLEPKGRGKGGNLTRSQIIWVVFS